jgi:hypothetical protein
MAEESFGVRVMNFFLILLVFTANTLASVKVGNMTDQYNLYRCKDKMNSLIQKWEGSNDWRGHISKMGTISLKMKTQKFAHWIIANKENNKEEISLMNPKRVMKVVFNSDCNPKTSSYEHNQYSNSSGMDDKRLLDLFVSNQKGIIVMWSPGMQHSFNAIKRLQKISKERKIPITFVMDPFANSESARKSLKKHGISIGKIQKLSSLELSFRDAMMHYPSFFVYKNGQIISNVIPGVMTSKIYKKTLNFYLGTKI